MERKRILIVHPYDKSTSFLERIKNYLLAEYESDIHYFSIKPNDASHELCLKRIDVHNEKGLIIFLGHGRSDKLYGSKADKYSAFVSEDAVIECPELYYYNDNFINEKNISVFKGKKVFCLACNSREKLAQFALEKGVTSFLGFGDIPTSLSEFEEKEEKVTNDVVVKMKTELNYIIKKSLSLSIAKGLTFEGLLSHIQFITQQRLTDVLTNQKSFKERYVFADFLYYLKNEIQIMGDRNAKLLE